MSGAIVVTEEQFIVFRDEAPLSISDRRKVGFFARHCEPVLEHPNPTFTRPLGPEAPEKAKRPPVM